jgi:uracil-DNA glycosylase
MGSAVAPFPRGVLAVPKPIEGTAFFPGGLGLWMEKTDRDCDFPTGGCMVVGQDFNTVATYERALQNRSEIGASQTWRVLSRLLVRFNIRPEWCFYTNAYMGLRAAGPETGRFCGARDKDFVNRCAKFFSRQLAVARPRLILMLGMEPLRVFGPRLFGIEAPRTLTACDNLYPRVCLDYGDAAIVVLTHPSLYYANVGRRRYLHFVGADAEAAMVRDAMSGIGLWPIDNPREVGLRHVAAPLDGKRATR